MVRAHIPLPPTKQGPPLGSGRVSPNLHAALDSGCSYPALIKENEFDIFTEGIEPRKIPPNYWPKFSSKIKGDEWIWAYNIPESADRELHAIIANGIEDAHGTKFKPPYKILPVLPNIGRKANWLPFQTYLISTSDVRENVMGLGAFSNATQDTCLVLWPGYRVWEIAHAHTPAQPENHQNRPGYLHNHARELEREWRGLVRTVKRKLGFR